MNTLNPIFATALTNFRSATQNSRYENISVEKFYITMATKGRNDSENWDIVEITGNTLQRAYEILAERHGVELDQIAEDLMRGDLV